MKQRSTETPARSVPGTQAVVRALSLLRTVGDSAGGCGLSKLATAHGLHKTTALRLLGALEREGFVAREAAAGTYRLGPAALALGSQARDSIDLRSAARPILAALAARSGETATLETRSGDEVIIIDEVHGRFLVGATPEVGTRWPAHATATGKILLAAARHESGGEPPSHKRGRLARFAPKTITSRAELERALTAAWQAGFAVTQSEIERDFVAIAGPVQDSTGNTVAAISVGGPSARITRARIPVVVTLVRQAAADLSRRLGAPPAPRGWRTSEISRKSSQSSG